MIKSMTAFGRARSEAADYLAARALATPADGTGSPPNVATDRE